MQMTPNPYKLFPPYYRHKWLTKKQVYLFHYRIYRIYFFHLIQNSFAKKNRLLPYLRLQEYPRFWNLGVWHLFGHNTHMEYYYLFSWTKYPVLHQLHWHILRCILCNMMLLRYLMQIKHFHPQYNTAPFRKSQLHP